MRIPRKVGTSFPKQEMQREVDLLRETEAMRSDLDRNIVEHAYTRWAPIYDAVCGPVMVQGRRVAAQAARAVGGKILEVGVGTGLSFDDYDATTEITGIDLCEPMLANVPGDACEVAAVSSTVRLDGYQDHDRAGDAGRH